MFKARSTNVPPFSLFLLLSCLQVHAQTKPREFEYLQDADIAVICMMATDERAKSLAAKPGATNEAAARGEFMVFHLWSLEAQAQGVKPQKLAEWVLKLHKRAASKEVSDYCSRGGSKRIQGMPYEVLEALVLKAQASLDEAKKR